jgi:hypothetical protein
MKDSPRIVLQLDDETTTKQVRDARARAWRFVLDCYAKKKAARPAPEPSGVGRVKHEKEVRRVKQRTQ